MNAALQRVAANSARFRTSLGIPEAPNGEHPREFGDSQLSDAIEAFHNAVGSHVSARERNLSARSVGKLCQKHVFPALEVSVARLLGVDTSHMLLRHCASPYAINRVLTDAVALNRMTDRLHRLLRPAVVPHRDSELTSMVDALRDVSAFLTCWPSARRITTRVELGMKGARRRLRSAEEQWSLEDWPYCELCWKLSQRAMRLERDAGQTQSRYLLGLSERFCTDHIPEAGTRYWSAQRRKRRFELLVKTIYDEIATNSQYRQRFVSLEDEAVWRRAQLATPEVMDQWLRRDLPPISPLQMRVRFLAFELSRRLPRQIANALQIASLQREEKAKTDSSLTLGEVAEKLGITKQGVSKRMKSVGVVDFDVESMHLRWWPFAHFRPPNAEQPPSHERHCGYVEWHEPVSTYLREIYTSSPEIKWTSIAAFKLA